MKYLSHLDVMRLLVRACRRAGLPLAYSGGFSPSPALSFALPLPVGVIGDQELVDVGLREEVSPDVFVLALGPQLPAGVEAVEAWPAVGKALSRTIVAAEYVVVVETDWSRDDVEAAINGLLARETFVLERTRGEKTRRVDVRPLILSLTLSEWREGEAHVAMRLVAESGRAGRPDDVVAALGLEDVAAVYRRTALQFREPIR